MLTREDADARRLEAIPRSRLHFLDVRPLEARHVSDGADAHVLPEGLPGGKGRPAAHARDDGGCDAQPGGPAGRSGEHVARVGLSGFSEIQAHPLLESSPGSHVPLLSIPITPFSPGRAVPTQAE